MLESGEYHITKGPSAGMFGKLLLRDEPLNLTIQNGKPPIPISGVLLEAKKIEKLAGAGGLHSVQITVEIDSTGQLFVGCYNPFDRSGSGSISSR